MNFLVCASVIIGAQSASLDELTKAHQRATAGRFDFAAAYAVNNGVFNLIERDQVVAADLFKAGQLLTNVRLEFEISRVKHELNLASLAAGTKGADAAVRESWDALMISTGRKQRLGTFKHDEKKYLLARAPKSVLSVTADMASARLRSIRVKDNSEVKGIVDADQKARQDFQKMTPADIHKMVREDKQRFDRVVALVEKGAIVTAKDFARASLVLQHGSVFEDYALAHELSMCSMILGNKDAAWLAAATYDRMLTSAGYRQRFATQYTSFGEAFKLSQVDTSGIGDVVRVAMHCPKLEDAKNIKF